MANQKWQKSSAGPDWTDIMTFAKDLEKLHESLWYLEMALDGYDAGSPVTVRALLLKKRPESGLRPMEVAVAGEWPNKMDTKIEHLIFRLLFLLDSAASKGLWEQRILDLSG